MQPTLGCASGLDQVLALCCRRLTVDLCSCLCVQWPGGRSRHRRCNHKSRSCSAAEWWTVRQRFGAAPSTDQFSCRMTPAGSSLLPDASALISEVVVGFLRCRQQNGSIWHFLKQSQLPLKWLVGLLRCKQRNGSIRHFLTQTQLPSPTPNVALLSDCDGRGAGPRLRDTSYALSLCVCLRRRAGCSPGDPVAARECFPYRCLRSKCLCCAGRAAPKRW